jgi:hypothetical protein
MEPLFFCIGLMLVKLVNLRQTANRVLINGMNMLMDGIRR